MGRSSVSTPARDVALGAAAVVEPPASRAELLTSERTSAPLPARAWRVAVVPPAFLFELLEGSA